MSDFTYKYWAIVRHTKDIYDADTITLFVDLGLGNWTTLRTRLAEIDAWELRGEERPFGLEARDWVRIQLHQYMVEERPFVIETIRDRKGKYGRYLVKIFIEKDYNSGEYGLSLNNELVRLGHAEIYDG
jgi:endonuclease YncB( thermonuclease family)